MSISLSDPAVTIAGIRQFGLAPDGSDLRDLTAAFERLRGKLALENELNNKRYHEIERLRYALVFYADKTNYVQRGWQGDPMPSVVNEDHGALARSALEQKGAGDENTV